MRLEMPAGLREFRVRRSPLGPDADRRSLLWAREWGLAATEETEERLAGTGPGRLAAYCYPNAEWQHLCVTAYFLSWLFLMDDRHDEGPAGRRPEELEHRLAGVFGHLESAPSCGGGVPQQAVRGPHFGGGGFGPALGDIARRLEESSAMAPEWHRRFRHHIADYFRACVWQAAHRSNAETPVPEGLPAMRRDAGAVMTVFDLMEFVAGTALPAGLYYSGTYQRLLVTAGNVVCWTNDLMTWDKELAHGDDHNLALSLYRAAGRTLSTALGEVMERVEDEVARFASAEAELAVLLDVRNESERVREAAAECVAMLKCWMKGHVDWGQETMRYLPAEPCDTTYGTR